MKEVNIKDEANHLFTRWAKNIDKNCPLNEYPRPQMKRESWFCLNGEWEYAIRNKNEEKPINFDGKIIVPFSPESILSGVNRQLKESQVLWYKRFFNLNDIFKNFDNERERILLHFGAVDQNCKVYINNLFVGENRGGYWPFYFDITGYIKKDKNELLVEVIDNSDKSFSAYGKQKINRGGIWYTAQSGIWQTVWLEKVTEKYIKNIFYTPDIKKGEIEIRLEIEDGQKTRNESFPDISNNNEDIFISIFENNTKIAEIKTTNLISKVKINNPHLWSCEDPFLYNLTIEYGKDRVKSYFGMREFGKIVDKDGYTRFALNGKPIFLSGVLDQGYYSDGLYTACSDEAMVWELSRLKEMGFNMIRKHIKIEPLRWYYHCDRLGLIVWQDFPSGGYPYRPMITQILPFIGIHIKDNLYSLFGRKEPFSRKIFENEAERTINHLYNVVSIAVWVIFNEGWGQFDSKRITEKVKSIDKTRLIDSTSGWHDQKCGDFYSKHIYYKRFKLIRKKTSRIKVLSEFGGYSYKVEGHVFSNKLFGYKIYTDLNKLNLSILRLYEKDVISNIKKGLSACVYTQLSDVEDELNGLFTYDREFEKVDEDTIKKINKKINNEIIE
ncbi:MAG: sugar-binding domain-containing protein [Spirochaetota bacterium]